MRSSAALAVVLMVGAAACAPSAVGGSAAARTANPGVSASSITFGSYSTLSGPAAQGHGAITRGSRAFFSYVDAHGGVFGRRIHLISADGGDQASVADAVHRLVADRKVFAMIQDSEIQDSDTSTNTGLGGYLSASGVPDVFVEGQCRCGDGGASQSFRFGWQPEPVVEGKILGQYITQHFANRKVGVLYEDDAFGRGGLSGIRDEVPEADIAASAPYRVGTKTLAPQIGALKASGARVMVDFTLPTYTAMGQMASRDLGYAPKLVVSNEGIDPRSVEQAAKALSRGAPSGGAPSGAATSGPALIDGAISDGYLPSAADVGMMSPWIDMFRAIYARSDPNAPFDGYVVDGMASSYTLVEALMAAGPHLTRQKLVDTIDDRGSGWKGPGIVPFQYSKADHDGYTGVQLGRVSGGKLFLFGNPLTTGPSRQSPIRLDGDTITTPPAGGIPTGSGISDSYQMTMGETTMGK